MFWEMWMEVPFTGKLIILFFAVVFLCTFLHTPVEKWYHKHFTKAETVKAQLRVITKVRPFISKENKTPNVRRPNDEYMLGFRTEDKRNKFFTVSWQVSDTLAVNTEGMLTFKWTDFISFTDAKKIPLKEGESYTKGFFKSEEEFYS